MKPYLLIFFSLLQLNNGFFIPPENFQKCGLDESLGVILCIAVSFNVELENPPLFLAHTLKLSASDDVVPRQY